MVVAVVVVVVAVVAAGEGQIEHVCESESESVVLLGAEGAPSEGMHGAWSGMRHGCSWIIRSKMVLIFFIWTRFWIGVDANLDIRSRRILLRSFQEQ